MHKNSPFKRSHLDSKKPKAEAMGDEMKKTTKQSKPQKLTEKEQKAALAAMAVESQKSMETLQALLIEEASLHKKFVAALAARHQADMKWLDAVEANIGKKTRG